MEEFDFIIVGAGSAGCVLAHNLVKSGKYSVLLLEAGKDHSDFWITTPLGYGRSIVNSDVNWMYSSQAEDSTAGRNMPVPRGKIVGGSSAINAMVYMRGTQADYEEWGELGHEEWAWPSVLESYKKIENHFSGDETRHGTSGPLEITTREDAAHPICDYFLRGCDELQVPRNDNFNGESLEGAGYYHHTIGKDKKRMSAARVWIKPIRRHKNFKLIAEAHVLELVLTGNEVTGVRYRKHGQEYEASARCEVVLSAGAINTPQLLMVSGIGPGMLLQDLNIEVKQVMPAVGENMQDHYAYDLHYRSKVPTMNQQLSSLFGRLKVGFDYFIFGRGPLTSGTTHAGGFIKTDNANFVPNMQLYFSPLTRDRDPGSLGRMAKADSYAAFLMSVCNTRPKSRGRVTLKSRNIFDAPNIFFNFLTERDDLHEMVQGVCFLRQLANTSAMREIIDHEYLPGPDVVSYDGVAEDVRARGYSIYHPCGTCRMGDNGLDSVVNSRLKAHGLKGLRIADASILPFVVTGNLNGPCMMIGQRASEIILEDYA